VGGDHADRPQMVFAALDHLGVVDAGELGVASAGVVGGADQGGAQQPVAGLAEGLAFAVDLAGLRRLGRQAGEGPELAPVGKAAGAAHGGDQGGPTDLGQAGQAASQAGWVDRSVAGLPLSGVPVEFGLVTRSSRISVWTSAANSVTATAGWSAYSSGAAWATCSHCWARAAPC
jgi:hypothetical protein